MEALTAGNELYPRRINLDFALKGEPISSGQRGSNKCGKNAEEMLGKESYVSFPFLHLRFSEDNGSHFRINS